MARPTSADMNIVEAIFVVLAMRNEKPTLDELKRTGTARQVIKKQARKCEEAAQAIGKCFAALVSRCDCHPGMGSEARAPLSDHRSTGPDEVSTDLDDWTPPLLGVDLSPAAVNEIVAWLKTEAETFGFAKPSSPTLSHADNPEYATPPKGSRTEARAKAAHEHIAGEIVTLMQIIERFGVRSDDGHTLILFGTLFEIYSRISDKVVGMLLRARKYGLLFFRGEILLQRRDDREPILLLKTSVEARNFFRAAHDADGTSGGFHWGRLAA